MTGNPDITIGCPPPTEESLFTDWSSEDSPQERTTQQLQSARNIESRGVINQEQTERESRDVREVRHVPESVMTSSSTREQANQVGTGTSDREPNTVVEIQLTRDEEIIHAHSQGVQVPSPNDGLSTPSLHMDKTMERTGIPNIMPQLDGPASVCMQRRHPLPNTRRTTIPGGGFPDDSGSDSHGYRLRDNRGYHGRRRHYQERGGRPPERESNQGQGYPG